MVLPIVCGITRTLGPVFWLVQEVGSSKNAAATTNEMVAITPNTSIMYNSIAVTLHILDGSPRVYEYSINASRLVACGCPRSSSARKAMPPARLVRNTRSEQAGSPTAPDWGHLR